MPFITTVQAPLPLQAPPQPPKVEPPVAVAVSATELPLAKFPLHVAPQLIPAGLLVTVPFPVLVTVRSALGAAVNCAVTVWFPFITTTQAPVPLQAPPQPVKVDPPVGVAVSATVLPVGKFAMHPSPQLIPLGILVTVPVPVPDLVTARREVLAAVLKTATTVALPLTMQEPVPPQPAPLHPAKADPGDAAADKTTEEPASKGAEQVPPQSRPPGVDVTVPLPAPCFWTVTVNVGASRISIGPPAGSVMPLVLPE